MRGIRIRGWFAFPVLGLALGGQAWAGGIAFVEVQHDGVGGVNGLQQASAVTVSPDGAHVYVAGRNDDAVAVLSRNPATGALTFVEAQINNVDGVHELRQPVAVAVSPDGAHVYLASFLDDAVVVFGRNAGTGALTFLGSHKDGVGGVTDLRVATSVTVSPDGAHVYATGQESDAVVVFSRNPATGSLTFVESKVDGVGGVDGIRRPAEVTLSPDGAHVYVAGEGDGAVAVFSRNAGTGALTFVEAQRDGVAGVDGIARASGVAVSPDGANVYVTGEQDSAVATFIRNPGTGALTFLEFDKSGRGGIHGLQGAQSVVVSPDGKAVYVAGQFQSAVAFLLRSPATGALSFFESAVDNKGGFDGLDQAFALALSPDGTSLYGAARGESEVGVFAADSCGNGNLGVDEQCDDGNLTAGDGCSGDCRLEACGLAPLVGCRLSGAGRSSLQIGAKATNDNASKLGWKWRGEATPVSAFGDPLTTDSYVLCVYDASPVPQPRLSLAAPPGGTCKGKPCWMTKSFQLRYKDALLTPDGLSEIVLTEGLIDDHALISFKGKRAHLVQRLELPLLPLSPPVTVQAVNAQTGACWDSVFSFVYGDERRLKGHSD